MAKIFATDPTTNFRSKLQSAVQRLAASNIFVGMSSWKYTGWTGQIYDWERYSYRGKFRHFGTSRLRDLAKLNEEQRNFRVIGPDETIAPLSS